jgi:hypothetical protein
MQDNRTYPGVVFLSGIGATLIAACIFMIGWTESERRVMRDCNKLSSFYVGNVVYECKRKQIDK